MKKGMVKFTKIPLKIFIDALVALYDGGADYVDILGDPSDQQDEIGLAIREEYMSPDDELEWGDEEYEDDDDEEGQELKEEDLNDLI